MKRYMVASFSQAVIESDAGEWVRYEDAQAEITDLQSRLDRWNHGGNYVGTNAKIKELEAENKRLRADVFNANSEMERTHLELDALEAEIEWLREDAAMEGEE